MGSGGGLVKTGLNVATGGAYGALAGSHSQKKALEAQTEAMEKAQKAQREAQEKALAQQRLAQEQTNQANERATRATANINRDVKDVKNSADLTGGIAKKAKTTGASLGSDESLGLDDDEDSWY